MKFYKLLKKELKELVTFQSLLGLVVSILVFVLLGNVMGDVGKKMNENAGSVVVVDNDNSQTTADAIGMLKQAGYETKLIDMGSDSALITKAKEFDHSSVMVLPKGFEEGIKNQKPQEIKIVSGLTSFAVMSNSDSSATAAAEIVKQGLTTKLIQDNIPGMDAAYIQSPITTTDVTVVKDKSEPINATMLQGFAMQQSMFIPIIVFILIMFAAQLNASAIANEKGDKTLETLLSTPVSRLSVLGAKMCASAIFSLLMAAVYMVGFSSYMGGMMGGMTGGTDITSPTGAANAALQNLGLQLGPMQFALIGVQLFLTISIALTVSMILGALAKDLKSAQSLMMPLMFFAMIPYLVTMLMDVGALPTVAKLLLYAIPFTHTFIATSSLLFGDNLVFFGGIAYQIVILAITLFVAVRVFSTDKIFTMTLEFKKKNKKNKTAHQE